MTEMEMPSLELGRYLDLLKRRKWQLVPAAILGLLAGLLVAWLIPRYYEARTRIRLYPTVLSSQGSARQDPFLAEVRKARITIANPKLLTAAVAKLEDWTDFHVLPEYSEEYRRKIYALIDRVWVYDLDGSLDGRTSALLEIGYRDRDPMRAADFANTISELYLERERNFVKESAQKLKQQLDKDALAKEKVWKQWIDERKNFYIQNPGLNPFETNILGNKVHTEKPKALVSLLKELADLEIDIATAKRRVEKAKEELEADGLEKTTKVPYAAVDATLVAQLEALQREIKASAAFLRAWSPSNPNYAFYKTAYEKQVAQYDELSKRPEVREKLEQPNPAYVAALKAHEDAKFALKNLELEQEKKLERKAKLVAELHEMPRMLARVEELNARVSTAEEAWRAAATKAQSQATQVAELQSDGGVIVQKLTEAIPPPAPTYPNNWLISLIGAVIGTIVAVGLIFVLDFLQPTMKTIEEVARALPVPALGGLSFLELPEEILASKRRRVRVATIAIVLFLLLGGVVAVYLIEPLRLPAGVQWLLDKILQGA